MAITETSVPASAPTTTPMIDGVELTPQQVVVTLPQSFATVV